MKVRFWGVRGSIASAIDSVDIEKKIRKILELASPSNILSPESIDNFINTLPFSLRGTYGGNTTCLEIRTDNNDVVIIDAGTGLRKLGYSLMKDKTLIPGKTEITHFFTHTHWDHIQGLMFFVPMFIPGNVIHMHSCIENLKERLAYQQVNTHFPLGFHEFPATVQFSHFNEGESIKVKGLEVITKFVRHPGGNYTLKFKDEHGKTFVFCSDAEFNLETLENINEYIDFFKDVDVLVFDTQYTFEESLQKIDWGHTSASMATDIAMKANVKNLILFHHDPTYDDAKMDAVTLQALKYKETLGPKHHLKIEAAYEGMELNI